MFTHGLMLCSNFFVEHPSSGVLIILLIIGRFFIFDLGRSLNAGHDGGLLDGEPAELLDLLLLPSLVREEASSNDVNADTPDLFIIILSSMIHIYYLLYIINII